MSLASDSIADTSSLEAFLRENQLTLTVFARDQEPPADFYQTHSGLFQDRFVTMWPLIENVDLFDEATRLASQELLRICAAQRAQVVVGSTMTVRHLFEGMRPRVSEGLRLEHLGNYPLLPLRAEHLVALKGRRVIVFTDVVSSGRLIDDTVSFLDRNDVKVVAVVALVRLVHDFTGSRISQSSNGSYCFRTGSLSLPFVCYHEIDVAARRIGDASGAASIPMDPTTVLPQAQTDLRRDPFATPELDLEDEASAISENEELRLGYYRAGHDRFTAFLNIDSIVKRHIGRIRTIIRDRIAAAKRQGLPRPILVSTPSKENRDLLRAVLNGEDGHRLDLEYVLFSRVDEFEGSSAYFLLCKHENVRGRPAIVLLSSIQSTETVRWLSAILSLNGCPTVTILCVVNRTSPASASFLARILRLRTSSHAGPAGAHGLHGSDASQERRGDLDSNFELIAILRLWDLSTPDLATMEALAQAQFQRFWERCGGNVLLSLSRTDLRYFQPRDVYELPPTREAVIRRPRAQGTLSQDMQVCLAAMAALMERNPVPLIELIGQQDLDKNSLFAIYRYLLGDPSTLGFPPHSLRLSEAFATALEKADARIGIAAASADLLSAERRDELSGAIVTERHLLVGAGLFSQFLSPTAQYGEAEIAIDRVGNHVRALLDRFQTEPLSVMTLARLSDISWSYALTFAATLLELVTLDDEDVGAQRTADALEHIKESVSQAATRDQFLSPNIRLVCSLAPSASADGQDMSVLISLIAALSGIIETLRPERHVSTGQCLAEIRREVFWPKPHHTFCYNNLRISPRRLLEIYDEAAQDGGELSFRDTSRESEALAELNNLIYAASKLSRISSFAKILILETYENGDWVRYFVSQDSDGFDLHIREMTEIAQIMRSRQAALHSEIDSLITTCDQIVKKIWGDPEASEEAVVDRIQFDRQSEFFRFISQFENDFAVMLDRAVAAGRDRISRQTGVVRDRIEVEIQWLAAEKLYVLCDPGILFMALENFVSNFKYSQAFDELPADTSRTVIGSIRVEADGETVTVTFQSRGERLQIGPEGRLTTTEDHRRRLRDFDCYIEEEETDGGFGISLQLREITKKRGEIE